MSLQPINKLFTMKQKQRYLNVFYKKKAVLWAYYTSLFAELTAESKHLSENFKFCMCDPKDVIKKMYNNILLLTERR